MQRNYYYLITKKEERTRSFLSTASYKYMKLIKKNRKKLSNSGKIYYTGTKYRS